MLSKALIAPISVYSFTVKNTQQEISWALINQLCSIFNSDILMVEILQVCQRRGQTSSQLDGSQGGYRQYSHPPVSIALTQHHQVHQSADFRRKAQAAQVSNRLKVHQGHPSTQANPVSACSLAHLQPLMGHIDFVNQPSSVPDLS